MLIQTMEEYANFGFRYIKEKIEDNPNYFYDETAFLNIFLSFDANNKEDFEDEPESLDQFKHIKNGILTQLLQTNKLLQQGKYRIIKVLGQGGSGITYLATQVNLGNRVAIKELFVQGVNDRDSKSVAISNPVNEQSFAKQKEKFIKEARRISEKQIDNFTKIVW